MLRAVGSEVYYPSTLGSPVTIYSRLARGSAFTGQASCDSQFSAGTSTFLAPDGCCLVGTFMATVGPSLWQEFLDSDLAGHVLTLDRYVGRTGLTVIGPGSGRRYRFEHFGHRILVDDTDRQSLAALPQLRLVVGTRPR